MKDKFYLTTAIHYANAAPHIGHAYEDVLADIIARYKRGRGFDTWFLTGTDEHGSKILRTAREKGMGPQAFVDMNTEIFKELFGQLNISYDDFIRTSDKEKHWAGVIALWKALEKSGDIYKKKYEGLYCVGCESFISERDLVEGKCPFHNVAPEIVSEENYFFRLSKYAPEITEKIEKDEIKVVPQGRKNEILSFLKDGVEDISFSRPEESIPWGIPVPDDPSQIMYVWCDALSNYITAVGYGRDEKEFGKRWPAELHIVGKDILRFHAVYWPAMLMSAGIPLPRGILVHGFITIGGKKMSKSVGNVIDPKEMIDKYGAEALRYFMAREISPFEDGDFTEAKFVESYNANLANGLGNLVSRVLKMSESYFAGTVKGTNPEGVPMKERIGGPGGEEELQGYGIPFIIHKKRLPKYYEWMDQYEIQKASDVAWKLVQELDGYVSAYEPFKLIKTDRAKTEDVIWNLLYGLYYVAKMITPVLPATAQKINELLGATLGENGLPAVPGAAPARVIRAGGQAGEPASFQTGVLDKPLFARIAK